MLASVYSYRVMVKSVSSCCVRGSRVLSNPVTISDGWWKSFLHRNQDLSLRCADSAVHIRMDSINKESINQYFNLPEQTVTMVSQHSEKPKPNI